MILIIIKNNKKIMNKKKYYKYKIKILKIVWIVILSNLLINNIYFLVVILFVINVFKIWKQLIVLHIVDKKIVIIKL